MFPSTAAIAGTNGKAATYAFMQDGASSHKVPTVLKAIKRNTPKSLSFDWPAKSPDLNPCDFLLWRTFQHYIDEMETAPKNESGLRTAVLVAAGKIDVPPLAKAAEGVYTRCKKCSEMDGGRFEHALRDRRPRNERKGGGER